MNWDAIEGATGYKVWMFNGRAYQEFDAGANTTWTTQNKGIWPTKEEIKNGQFTLHYDQKGSELALNPSDVYKNAGYGYEKYQKYWFRLSAYDDNGETVYSSKAFEPSFSEPTEFLGKEEYWSFTDVPNGEVNIATGNLIISEDDISISGRGPSLGVARTYNSLSPAIGMFGAGWHSDLEMSIVASSDQLKLIDEDSTLHIFNKQADGSYKPPTGIYLELTETENEYILKSKDQTKVFFNKTSGKIEKMMDGHNNTLKYYYDQERLSKMEDASGRALSFAYTEDGKVKEIIAPENRKIVYEYSNDFLTKVTQTAGEVTQYEYNDAMRLSKLYEPTHQEKNPSVTTFLYQDQRLAQVVNAENHAYSLTYDKEKNEVDFINPNGSKDRYRFNEAANPIVITQDVDQLNITTSYIYEGNNLKETKVPNDQGSSKPTESYQYDENGNVTSATDSYGTETYQYNENNDVTKIIDTENEETTIAYDDLNPVSETSPSDQTSSVAKYDSYGNVIESSSALSNATNLLENASFEQSEGLSSWNVTTYNDSGSLKIDSTTQASNIAGQKSLKIQSTSTTKTGQLGYVAATQEVTVSPNTTYTLSGRMKTDLTNANAFFNVKFLDKDKKGIGWQDNRYSQMTKKHDWMDRQLTFTTPSNTASILIYLEVDHFNDQATGEAWFDGIQLEKSDVSSTYNPIINSSFEKTFNGWTGSGGSIDSSGFDGSASLKATGSMEYKQTLELNQNDKMTLKALTLTGLSKALNVTEKGSVSSSDYALTAKVVYQDGTTKDYVASFPKGSQEWNRSAVKIPASKPIKKLEVILSFKGNYSDTVWFDAIRLIEGSVLTKNSYDENHNYVTKVEDAKGNIVQNKYDTYGNKMEAIDEKNQSITYAYDKADQLQSLNLPNGASVNYQYDLNGNMTSKEIVSNGKKQPFQYQYNGLNQLLKTTGPLNDITVNEYDENGNKIKTTLPRGNDIKWSYDGFDRINTISYNDKGYYRFAYDKNGNETTVEALIDGYTKTREYDKSNRLTKVVQKNSKQDWLYPTESDKLKTFTFTHKDFSQTNEFSYNKQDSNTLVKNGSFTFRFDYDEDGNVQTFTSGNGAGSTFSYDDLGLVDSLNIGTDDGQEILFETYEYDANGNRTKIESSKGTNKIYAYDSLDQLVKETRSDGTLIEYEYDGFGNRVLEKGTNTSPIVSSYNLANQLVQYGDERLSYDDNGNRLEDGKFIYHWNDADQLASVTKKGASSPIATYRYDEDGRRIQKVVNGKTINYYYHGDSLNVLYETNENDEVIRSYTYSESGILLSMNQGNSTYFYHYNAHGDVIALTDKDSKVVAEYEYDAWGNVLKAEEADEVKTNPYRYAGYQYDHETGLYYLIARYYQPTHGVFLSLDPDPGDDDDILTQNGYTYANNNPVMLVDPDGHWVWLAVNAGFAVYDGYKAYKSGGNWKQVAWAAGSNFIKLGYIKKASRTLSAVKKGRTGRQGKLKALVSDPKAPKHVKGFIKNQMRHRKINGKKRHLNNPPGYELAHKRGYEARKGYSYRYTVLQNTKNHKLQHKYDRYGKKR
ncbi:RHS repeat-associated core domain-containing protein [Bacillus carboniphilus]|uniref:RHS repeat-associated core domain-containing protein n=1 Tax=Bacillus carboniphilus TaxID=86663 RepID=A0ABY9JZN2_9BACI|nr:RHS repeat-associated core domain-containing protein [Bacillus carboniphilus]WLR43096.1 RHS repeat-associated core domain-containing protein [Bacillus carboniphilus]